MPDQRGWPHAANPGFPQNPDQDGWHLIEDDRGTQQQVYWLSVPKTWAFPASSGSPDTIAKQWKYVRPVERPGFQSDGTRSMPPLPGPRRES